MALITSIVLGITLSVAVYAEVTNKDKPINGNWDFKMDKIWEIEEVGVETGVGDLKLIKYSVSLPGGEAVSQ